MSPEDRISVLMRVSISDVHPHIDHAARALSSRRRRRVTRQYAAASLVVAVGLLAVIATQLFGRSHRASDPAADIWPHVVTLDGGHLTLAPPPQDAQPPVTREEAISAFLADPKSANTVVVATHWGLTTIRTQEGKNLAAFDHRPSWAIVFRVKAPTVTCPAPAARPSIGSGDYSDAQVFVVGSNGQHALYSQPGSWSCGLPARPVTKLPETVD